MTNLPPLIAMLIVLSSVCFAQGASLSSIWTAGGFLNVCSGPDDKISTERMEALQKVPPSEFVDKLKKAMADRTADVVMCLAFVSGLEQGWKEGHEHGVIAAQFPEAWPKDEKKALATLPLKQVQAPQTAMTTDVPCIPSYVTIGQERDIVVKYIREQQKKNPFITIAMTYHVVWLAFQEAFPCPAQATKPPDAVR